MARQYPTLTRNGFLLPERIKASYEGAGEGRRSASWDAPDVGINSINTPALRNLRARSRAAVRNDPYAFNVIDKRVSNLIGTGITPRPKIDDDALRKVQQELWEDWVDESDADGLTDFYGQQALIARTVEYRTVDELLKARDQIRTSLVAAAGPRSKVVRLYHGGKGL